MGTRSLTVVVDNGWDKPTEICVLYRQMDGYLSGHGKDLKKFCDGFVIVNGIGAILPKMANGASCFAAQLVSHFKGNEVGSFYLHAAGTRNCGEEYTYIVIVGKPSEDLQIEVVAYGKSIFKGAMSAFDPEAIEREQNEAA